MNKTLKQIIKLTSATLTGAISFSVIVLSLPAVALAEALFEGGNLGTGAGSLTNFMDNTLTFISNAVIPFLLAVGFVVFVWGMFQFFIYGGANDESKSKGKSLMIYATAGFVAIIIFWGLVNLIAGSTGLGDPNDVSNMDDLTPKVNPVK
jgi:hypothetical protein